MAIRESIRRAKREPTTEHLEEMWRDVFLLKAWYFLPAEETEGPNRPMVAELDGESWLPAFTDVRHYRAFAGRVGLRTEDGETHGLLLDPGESMDRIVEVRDVIRGVVFNPGSDEAIRAPVDALEEYARHFEVPGYGDDPLEEPGDGSE